MEEIKLLALDMDGTAYIKMGGVVPANIKPIQEAIAQGVEVVFATGRPHLAEPNQIQENGFATSNTLLIAYNGGAIYDVKTKKIVRCQPIDAKTAFEVFSLVEKPEYQGVVLWGYVAHGEHLSFTNASDPLLKKDKPLFYRLEMNFFDGQFETKTAADLKNSTREFFKFLAFDATPEFLTALRKLGLEVASSDSSNAEITAKGVNKKTALQWVGNELKISPQNMMAIGDGANDLAMIEYVGVGVALKNSIPELKEIADLKIDLTNDEGAVGFVIENYVLKKEKENES